MYVDTILSKRVISAPTYMFMCVHVRKLYHCVMVYDHDFQTFSLTEFHDVPLFHYIQCTVYCTYVLILNSSTGTCKCTKLPVYFSSKLPVNFHSKLPQ